MLFFLENFSIIIISGRYRWVTNRAAVGKIVNDNRVIQSEKNISKSMLIEATVDYSNGLPSFRADKLDVRRP